MNKSASLVPMLKRAESRSRGKATPGERLMGKLYPNSSYASNWSANRYECVQHFVDWQFIAIRCIWNKISSITPNLAYVTDANEHRPGVTVKAGQRGLMNAMAAHGEGQGFGGSPWVDHGGHSYLTVGEWKSKALSVVKPHEELEPLESNHPLRRIVECPNPEDTLFDYTSELGMFLELCGSTYEWVIPSQTGKPCESWVIPAHWVWPRTGTGQRVDEDHPDADRLIQWYEVRPWGGTGSAGMLKLPPDEVITTKYKNPMNKLDGYGNLLAISRWIDVEESITKSRWAQFINKARPELWIELGPQFEDPDDVQMERLYSKIANRHQGELNTGKPLITPAGSKAQVLSFSPNEMDYVQSEDQQAGHILASWNVPKSAVGLVSDMTFGSILATLMQLCEGAINPRLSMLGQRRTKSLASRWDEETPAWSSRSYGGSANARRVKLWYDNCSPADPAQVNSDLSTDMACFAVTPNEVRVLRGRRSYGIGGDNPIVNGPGGPMPLPINVEEKMDDLGELVAMYTEQVAGKKDADKLGTRQSNEDISPEQVSGAGDEADATEVVEDASEQLADGGKVEEPNGKPSKSFVRKSVAFDSVQAAGKWLAAKWQQLETRYSRTGALAAAVAMVATSPLPGNIAAVIAIAEGIRFASGRKELRKSFRAWCKRWAKQYGGHDYSSTQFNLEGDAQQRILQWTNSIDDGDLHEKGREDIPHVTVLYGLEGSDAGPVRQLVETFGPVSVELGYLDYFPSDEYDVLIVRVDSEDLHQLHEALTELPHVQTHPEYQPHVTIAYLKPGMGQHYVDLMTGFTDDEQGIVGDQLEFTQLVFSPKEGAPTCIDIASYPAQEAGQLDREWRSLEDGGVVGKSWNATSLRAAAMSGTIPMAQIKQAVSEAITGKSEQEIEAICDLWGVVYRKNRSQLVASMVQVMTELVANAQRMGGKPFTASLKGAIKSALPVQPRFAVPVEKSVTEIAAEAKHQWEDLLGVKEVVK